MDPNVLRVLTDPQARQDPTQLKAAMRSMRQATRQSVLGSVRLNALVMSLVGYAMLVGACVVGALSLLGLLPKEAGFGALGLATMGALFALLARSTALPPRSLLRHGTPYSATVVEVRGLGRSIGIEKPGVSATLSQVTVVLSIPQLGPAGSNIVHREYILGGDLAQLQRGASIPVRCDPQQPTRLAIDWDAA